MNASKVHYDDTTVQSTLIRPEVEHTGALNDEVRGLLDQIERNEAIIRSRSGSLHNT